MISAFHMGPNASGCGQCDRVFFKVAKSRVKNREVLAGQKCTDYIGGTDYACNFGCNGDQICVQS